MRLLAIALILACTPAFADPLAEAHRREAALDYDGALGVVERALATGAVTDPAQYVELHLLAGRFAAGLDRPAIAQRHFAVALALAPATTLPEGTSPKLVAPFDAARAATVALQITAAIDAQRVATIAPAGDPLGLVVGIAVRAGGRDLVARATTRLALPAGAIATELAALDRDGNHIWSAPAPAPPIVVAPPPPPVPPPRERAIAARWSTWTIVAAGFAASAGIAAWRFGVAQDDWNTLRADPGHHDFSTLVAAEDRARRDALIANLGFGLAGAAAIAATIFAVRGDPVTITAAPGAIGVAGHF